MPGLGPPGPGSAALPAALLLRLTAARPGPARRWRSRPRSAAGPAAPPLRGAGDPRPARPRLRLFLWRQRRGRQRQRRRGEAGPGPWCGGSGRRARRGPAGLGGPGGCSGRCSAAVPRGRAVPPWPPPTLRPRVPSRRVPARSAMAGNGERTFIAIKPDGVQRGLVGEIIKRFEQKGFRLVAMKFVHVSVRAGPERLPSSAPSASISAAGARPRFLPNTRLLPFPKNPGFAAEV